MSSRRDQEWRDYIAGIERERRDERAEWLRMQGRYLAALKNMGDSLRGHSDLSESERVAHVLAKVNHTLATLFPTEGTS